jgi:5-methylcytosine-specific restriction endonuclease McrA
MAAYERVRRRQFRIDHADDPKPAPLATLERMVCRRCKIEKPGSEFSSYWQKPYCKRCHADFEMARNRRNGMQPAHGADYDAAGNRRCARCGNYRPTDQFPRGNRKTAKLSPHCKRCVAERTKDWRTKYPARARAGVREAYRKNGSKYEDGHRRWIASHPEYNRARKARRRAQKLGVDAVPFSAAEWLTVLELFGNRCAYCWKRAARLEQDHIQPLSRGGPHALANLVPACRSCNSRKNDKTLLQFLLTR